MEGAAGMAMVMMLVPAAMLRMLIVAIVTVCSTVYLEDDGAEGHKEANADSAHKHQGRPLGLV